MSEVNTKQTLGKFDITGYISVDSKVFTIGSKSKNNSTWTSNIFNPRIEGANGSSMYIRVQDGFDAVKGRTIYARSKDDKNLEIAFVDRNSAAILERVNEMSYIKIFTNRVKKINDSGKEYTTWNEPKKFLTMYDAIKFLKEIMPITSKNKVRLVGDLRYSKYNGNIQRNFDIKYIYILNDEEAGAEKALEFKFTQNVIIREGAADISKLKSEGIAIINSNLYVKKPKTKEKYELLDLPLIVRVNDDSEMEKKERAIKRCFTVTGDTIRRINIEGIFNVGYTTGNVTSDDLPDTALELIEDGLYSEEEVMGMFAKRDRVDELVFKRPIAKVIEGKLDLDLDETTYSIKDIEEAMKETDTDEVIRFDEEDNSILSELENC